MDNFEFLTISRAMTYILFKCYNFHRFNNFLFSKVSKLCSRSKHKSVERLLVEVHSYDRVGILDRSKLLNKVCR